METQIHIETGPKQVAEAFAQYMKNWLSSSEEPFHIALSGGSTPKILFAHLADKYKDTIPWERIHLWWGDERMVPPEDKESNYRMTSEELLSKIDIPAANIHRIHGENAPEEEAVRYGNEIEKQIPLEDTWPVFDLMLLGMGDDGHTASIFPHQMELLQSMEICEVATHPVSGQKRITLTGHILNHAKRTVFLVTGTNKSDRVFEILRNQEAGRNYPAFYIQSQEELHWFLDKDAAKRL